jgi:hypothetical protein
MAQPKTPKTLFADFYRAHFKSFDGRAKAPNGEEISHYGETGAPMSDEFLTLIEESLNPIERLLVNKLMNPFIGFFCRPFRKLAARFRGGDPAQVVDQKVVDHAVISTIARVVVCLLANLILAASIGSLNSISGTTTRIIVMSVIGLVFAFLASFLGQESIPIYTLITT